MIKKEPHVLDIKKDKNYAWCQCNESEGQPFCDGSHAKTEHQPIVFKSDTSKEVAPVSYTHLTLPTTTIV